MISLPEMGKHMFEGLSAWFIWIVGHAFKPRCIFLHFLVVADENIENILDEDQNNP